MKNHLAEIFETIARAAQGPVVGEGVTIYRYTDAEVYTVVAVNKTKKTVTLCPDNATLLNGPNTDAKDAMTFQAGGFCGHMEGYQRYEYTPGNPEFTIKVTWRKKANKFIQQGCGWKQHGGTAGFGYRAKHYDYNF